MNSYFDYSDMRQHAQERRPPTGGQPLKFAEVTYANAIDRNAATALDLLVRTVQNTATAHRFELRHKILAGSPFSIFNGHGCRK